MSNPTPDTGSMPGTALDTMGDVLTSDLGRDAIHLAAIAVTSDERLFAGQHVGLVGEKKVSQAAPKLIGIVDPFLSGTGPVFPGKHFWLVLYPRTITSLRHVWTHPALDGEAKTAIAKASEEWLRNWMSTASCPSYEIVMRTIERDWKDGNGYEEPDYNAEGRMDGFAIHFDGRDAHGEIPPEFWTHVENVLGHPPRAKPSYFSCSC